MFSVLIYGTVSQWLYASDNRRHCYVCMSCFIILTQLFCLFVTKIDVNANTPLSEITSLKTLSLYKISLFSFSGHYVAYLSLFDSVLYKRSHNF